MITILPIEPTYKKDTGLWYMNTDSLPLPKDFEVKERSIVYIPSGEFGGNHKHPRIEAFVGIGDHLSIIWEDDEGLRHEDTMMTENQLFLCIVDSYTPHVVINRGSSFAMLVEFANGPNIDVEPVDLLAIPTKE